SSGAMQWAHHATAHAMVQDVATCSHEHDHPASPQPAEQHHECPDCHLLATWHASAPAAPMPLLAPGICFDQVAVPENRPTPAIVHCACGPRAPPCAA